MQAHFCLETLVMFHVKHAMASVAMGCLHTIMTERERVGLWHRHSPNISEVSAATIYLYIFIAEPKRVGSEGANMQWHAHSPNTTMVRCGEKNIMRRFNGKTKNAGSGPA